jgi:hypothetical protein
VAPAAAKLTKCKTPQVKPHHKRVTFVAIISESQRSRYYLGLLLLLVPRNAVKHRGSSCCDIVHCLCAIMYMYPVERCTNHVKLRAVVHGRFAMYSLYLDCAPAGQDCCNSQGAEGQAGQGTCTQAAPPYTGTQGPSQVCSTLQGTQMYCCCCQLLRCTGSYRRQPRLSSLTPCHFPIAARCCCSTWTY